MSPDHDFAEVFQHLRAILAPFSPMLNVKADTTTDYYLDGGYAEQFKKDIFFGAVNIKKNYVSVYLMGVYAFPTLLEGISPELRKRMQGKSCFNFKKVEPGLFSELAELAQRCYRRYEQEGWLVK